MSEATHTTVVFNMETYGAPEPIGTFARMEEDAVIYRTPDGELHAAPFDCVSLVRVSFPAIGEERAS